MLVQKKYVSLDRLTDYDTLIKAEVAEGDSNAISQSKSYTESKITDLVNGTITVAQATSATFAASADSATKAAQDGEGKTISSTYETKTDANSKLTEAKSYTDTEVAKKADSGHVHAIEDIPNLQSALDGKQDAVSGGATTIISSNLTANRALISNGSGKVAVSTATATELGYLSGVTSGIQGQLEDKANASALDDYYTKDQIDSLELITVDEIDAICGTSI